MKDKDCKSDHLLRGTIIDVVEDGTESETSIWKSHRFDPLPYCKEKKNSPPENLPEDIKSRVDCNPFWHKPGVKWVNNSEHWSDGSVCNSCKIKKNSQAMKAIKVNVVKSEVHVRL